MKNMFVNPWAKGEELYPYDVLNKDVINNNVLQNSEYKEKDPEPDQNQKLWFKKIGYELLKINISLGGKFTDLGMLVCISHANNENSWGQIPKSGQIPWAQHNWWNFGYLKSRGQKAGWQNSHTKFASFKSLKEAFTGYIDRVTSSPELVQWNNPNFNASFPVLGNINTRNVIRIPTEHELNEGCRIKIEEDNSKLSFPTITGNHKKEVDKINQDNSGPDLPYECYQYCGPPNDKYANNWISIIKKNKNIFRFCLSEISDETFKEMTLKIKEVYGKQLNTHTEYENWLAKMGNYYGDAKYEKCRPKFDEYDTAYSLKYSYNNDLLWR